MPSVHYTYKLEAKYNRLSDIEALKEWVGASDGGFYIASTVLSSFKIGFIFKKKHIYHDPMKHKPTYIMIQ